MKRAKQHRLWVDKNKNYHIQVRFIPVYSWEPDDGWRTIYMSDNKEEAMKNYVERRFF